MVAVLNLSSSSAFFDQSVFSSLVTCVLRPVISSSLAELGDLPDHHTIVVGIFNEGEPEI